MSSKNSNGRCLQILKSNLLVILTFIGAAVGFGIGIGIREYSPSDNALMWIGKKIALFSTKLKKWIL